MGRVGTLSGLNAKIHAMMPGLVSEQNYQGLIALGTERGIARYLSEHTRFASVFERYDIETLRRWEIELVILRELIVDLNKLRFHLQGDYTDLVDGLLLRYEVRDLKLVLRAIIRGEKKEEIKEHLMHDVRRAHVDFDRLISCTQITEVTALLKGTIFEEAVLNISEEDLDKAEFHLDMMLDQVYFRTLRGLAQRLAPEDRRVIEYGVALMIDLLNLQWIYRAKRYHDLLDEELLNYTLLGGGIRFQQLKRIIYAQDTEREVERAAAKIGFEWGDGDDVYLQVRIYRFYLSALEKYARAHPRSIAPFFYFVNRLEYETKDIITIIEGVRYQVSDIDALLVRGGERWQ